MSTEADFGDFNSTYKYGIEHRLFSLDSSRFDQERTCVQSGQKHVYQAAVES
jgi:hypothetical protein